MDGLYLTGGTDCGIPDCVEHAYLREEEAERKKREEFARALFTIDDKEE